ncbi:MAG: hypothetical protein Q9223_005710 [Gallowayella weberi]
MLVPLGYKMPRWKMSRAAIAARHKSASVNQNESDQDGDAGVEDEPESVVQHGLDSEMIVDYFDTDIEEYFSCDDDKDSNTEDSDTQVLEK